MCASFSPRGQCVTIVGMIDVRLLREESEKVKEKIETKNADPALVGKFLEVDRKWREAVLAGDELRSQQNKMSQRYQELTDPEKEELKSYKEKIKKSEEETRTLETERELIWAQIPNLPSDDTPIGKDESENKVVSKWGTPAEFDFTPLSHFELGEKLGIIDIKKAAEVSGSRFAYLKGAAVMLEFALVQYVLNTLQDAQVLKEIAENVQPGYSPKPFIPVIPPVMIRPETFYRMARIEPKDERYYMPQDDLYLIGSAEHTLGPLHMDEVIPEEELPLRYIGFSTSFRREAGTYGKDMQGILRVHQFDKLEMESFTTAEDGRLEQDFMVAIQEYLTRSLGIPYQVVSICTGDMGAPDARQIDIEMWVPSQNKYRETHTSDYNTDYQSRRLNTKVKRKDGSAELVHMNDATAFALSRTPIAIIENYQTKDGKVRVPEVLQKYLGKSVIE